MNEKRLAAIKAAYGDAWEKVKQYCDDSGFVERRVIAHGITNNMEPEKYGFQLSNIRRILHSPDGYYKWRPFALEGVENNNGWISCEDRMPEGTDTRKVHTWFNGKQDCFTISASSVRTAYEKGCLISHWRYAEEPKPPLY